MARMSDRDDAGIRGLDEARTLSHRRRAFLMLLAVALDNEQIAIRTRVNTQVALTTSLGLWGSSRPETAALVAKANLRRVLATDEWPPACHLCHHCTPAGT